MPEITFPNPVSAPEAEDTCNLKDYGISQKVVDSIFHSIVEWLHGDRLPWNQTRYINVFVGPSKQTVVELLCFHYDGPPEREIGGGGEFNHCKMYMYKDRVALNFTGENSENQCGLNFRYTTPWETTYRPLVKYLHDYLNAHLETIFQNAPRRFAGHDKDVVAIQKVVESMEAVLAE